MTTDNLLTQACRGDTDAYSRIMERITPRLLVYIEVALGARLRCALEPVDILQEAFLEAHRSFATFEHWGRAAFIRWMQRIIDNRIADQFDRLKALKRARTPLPRVSSPPGPSTSAAQEEELALLHRAMETLDDRARVLLTLHYFEGHSSTEIARLTRQSDRNVRRLLRGAEAELGGRLKRSDGESVGELLEAARSSTRPPGIPMTIGRYLVQGELGRGAAAVVYRAFDEEAGREVAIKLLRVRDASLRSRLAREVSALSRLSHPNIVMLLDHGRHEGAPFLVMQLVEGSTLHDRILAAPVSDLRAAHIVGELAVAVDHAHQRGVLHRDIKPQNVLMTPGGTAMLSDFGLAKLLDQRPLSRPGQHLGTEGFWPPEQARGELATIGPWSDVFSLGATLYAMLTGSPPVIGRTVLERIHFTLGEVPPRPGALRPGVAPCLEEICMKCLEKEPEKRFSSAAELASAISLARGVLEATRANAVPP